MADYLVKDTDMTVVADAIRAKGSTSAPLEFPKGMAYAVDAIQSGKPEQSKTVTITQNGTTEVTPDEGKALSKVTAVVEVQMENPLKYAMVLRDVFNESTFPDGSTININTIEAKEYTNMIKSTKGVGFSVVISTQKEVSRINIGGFAVGSTVKKIDFSGVAGFENAPHGQNLNQTFAYCSKLEEIKGAINASLADDYNAFANCFLLREVRFVPGTLNKSLTSTRNCRSLSPASVQSIIDGLADLSAGTAQTLTLNAAIQLSEAQRASITAKNWNLVQ